jgi:hypothetical protein
MLQGLKYEVEPLHMGAGQEQAQTQTPKPPTPPATGKEQFQTTVPPRRNWSRRAVRMQKLQYRVVVVVACGPFSLATMNHE